MILLALAACPAVPPTCAAFCDEATERWGSCLSESGQGWTTTAWGGPDTFRASCDTWAWEIGLLATDAGVPGEPEGACADGRALVADGDCAAVLAWDWDTPPWP